MLTVPLCALLLLFAPGIRELYADVFMRGTERAPLQDMVAQEQGERRITNRTCRFHGMSWDTQIQFSKASPQELIAPLSIVSSELKRSSLYSMILRP